MLSKFLNKDAIAIGAGIIMAISLISNFSDPNLTVALANNQSCNSNPEADLSGNITQPGTGIITNDSATCSYNVGLASYKMFNSDIDDQTLFDSEVAVIGPNQQLTLNVNLPSCAYQIDLFYGNLITSFRGGVRYGTRLLDGRQVTGSGFCINPTPTPTLTPTPSPSPTPSPTPTPTPSPTPTPTPTPSPSPSPSPTPTLSPTPTPTPTPSETPTSTPSPIPTPEPTPTPTPTPSCTNCGGGGGSVTSILYLEKFGRNVTQNEANPKLSVATKPNEIVEFTIKVSAYNFLGVSNVKLKDILPDKIIYVNGSTKVDDIGVNDDIVSGQGLDLGNIQFDSPKTVKFLATTASADQFSAGTMNLENVAQATSDAGSREARLLVTVQKETVLGISTIQKVAGIKTGFDTTPIALIMALFISDIYLCYIQTKFAQKKSLSAIIKKQNGDKNRFNFNI